MATLPELLAQHAVVNEQYNKTYIAQQCVAKRLVAAKKARSDIRKAIHAQIGPPPIGSLVMTLTGSRFYEVHSVATVGGYCHAQPVYQHTGECKVEGKGSPYSYKPTQVIELGSILPTPKDHPIYLKWEKRRFRDKLEGKE